MDKLIAAFIKLVGTIVSLWAMVLLTLQTMGVAPTVGVSGVSPWVLVVALAIGAGLVLGKKVIDMTMPSIGVGGDISDSIMAAPPARGSNGMGGAIDDYLKPKVDFAVRYLKIIVAVVLIVGVVGYVGSLKWQLLKEKQKVSLLTEGKVPADVKSRVIVKKDKTLVYNDDGTVTEIKAPRGGKDFTVDVRKDGSVKRDKLNEWLPYFTAIPHISVLANTKGQIEPTLGIQVVRSEATALGVNVDIGANVLAASLTKDILDNSNVGLYYGVDKNGDTAYGFKFGIYF